MRAVVDATGAVKETRDYYPFGLRMPGRGTTEGTPAKEDFTGYEKDETTQLLYAGQRYYMAAFGRFSTTDRFADKYPSLTPYQYAANNPATLVDVNGDSILVVHEGEGIIYHEGNLYWQGTGEKYDGEALQEDGSLSGFVGKSKAALDQLRSGGETGEALVDYLANIEETVTIQKGDENEALGGRVRWNPEASKSALDVNGNRKRPAFIGLGHELAHAYDAMDGKVNTDPWYSYPGGTVLRAERTASHFENLIRAENGVPLRQFYGPGKRGRLIVRGTNNVSNIHDAYTNMNGKERRVPFIFLIQQQ